MYRITKVLNHNAVLAVKNHTCKEYLIMGKGVGFGKKITESIEVPRNATVYLLLDVTNRENSGRIGGDDHENISIYNY